MKYSIQKQFTLIFAFLMAGTVLLCWFINSTFLEDYYLQNKRESMLNAYYIINQASNENTIDTEAFDIEFQKICSNSNMDIILLDAESRTLKTSMIEYEILSRQLLGYLFNPPQVDPGDILLKDEKYEMRIIKEERTKQDYLDMWGVLDNGNLFLLRSPLESIRESVGLANRFLAYVGLGAAVVSAIVIYFVTRKITKPIMELAGISERMSHLDFEAKYIGESKNEIAILGQNINALSETLETTISELKSANNELLRDIEKKNKIDEMRKEFLANVSHELKTPIALIQGYAEGLREGISDDPESREFYCEVIMDEASKMNAMVKKLLSLNQLEFGNNTVSMERFDITSMICNYLSSVDLLCKQKEIRVQMDAYPAIYVWADEFMTEEVFSNYFMNAMNHVAGNRVIDVKLMAKDSKVRISVFNTGDAIPDESLPFIWDKFYKVDKARTREYGGSGVGLSIVKAMMNAMNQPFGVCNYDNGVEFWFELERSERLE